MNTQLRGAKLMSERVLVLDNNIEAANTTTYHDDENIASYTNGVYNIEKGQVGFLCKDDDYFNYLLEDSSSLKDFDKVKKFTIIQGTGKTSISDLSGHGYQEQPYIESLVIDKRFPVYFDKAYVVNEMYHTVRLTGYNGLGKTLHKININQSGVKLQHQNSMEMKDGFSVSYLTPDYTTLGTAAANAKNDIYTNLAYKANLQSQAVSYMPSFNGGQPFVAFVMDVGGGTSQVVDGTTYSNQPTVAQVIAASTTNAKRIPFMYIKRNGVGTMQYFTANTALREALTKAVSAGVLTTGTTFKIVDLGGALSLATIDQILFVALDSKLAIKEDMEAAVKTQIFITAPQLADATPTVTTGSLSYEGQGKGRQWLIRWKSNAKNDVYTAQNYGYNYSFIQMPDYVKSATNYNVFTLLHGQEVDDFTPNDEHYYATFLLVPNMIPLTIGTPGTGNEAWAQVDENGTIVSVYFTTGGSGGSGTVTVPAIYGGSGAVLTPTYSGGGLTALAITSGGTGYSNHAPIGSAGTQSLDKVVEALTDYVGATVTAANGWNLESADPTFA